MAAALRNSLPHSRTSRGAGFRTARKDQQSRALKATKLSPGTAAAHATSSLPGRLVQRPLYTRGVDRSSQQASKASAVNQTKAAPVKAVGLQRGGEPPAAGQYCVVAPPNFLPSSQNTKRGKPRGAQRCRYRLL